MRSEVEKIHSLYSGTSRNVRLEGYGMVRTGQGGADVATGWGLEGHGAGEGGSGENVGAAGDEETEEGRKRRRKRRLWGVDDIVDERTGGAETSREMEREGEIERGREGPEKRGKGGWGDKGRDGMGVPRSVNPFIDAALAEEGGEWDGDDYGDLVDFIVCKKGRDYRDIFRGKCRASKLQLEG